MKSKIISLSVVALCCSSCLMYKEVSPERTDELKASAKSMQNVKISDKWITDRNSSTDFSFDWINDLKDPQLDALITEAHQYNADMIIAQEQLTQAELAMQIAASNLYPSVNAVANTTNNLIKGSHIHNLALKANWELDIWGKNKSGQMANQAQYFSLKYQNEKLKQSITAMVCKAYFLSVAGHIQQEKVAHFLTLTQDLEKLYTLRAKVGTANAIDVSNIRSEIIALEGQLERIQNANREAKRTLELLTSKYPQGTQPTAKQFTELKTALPESFPFSLLENRPDVLANQYLIESAFYQVQEAKISRLPSINIGLSTGAAFTNIDALNQLYSNPLVNLGGGVVAPIFNYGALKRNVEIRNSQECQAVEMYAKTMLNALAEVESAMSNTVSIEKQIDFGQRAVAELEKNITLTKKQIQVGTADSFILLQKQRDLLRKEMSLIDLELQNRIERINLYMALGGGQAW